MSPVLPLRAAARSEGLPVRWLRIEAGRLPHLKVGKDLLFNMDALAAELARRAAQFPGDPPGAAAPRPELAPA